MGSSCFCLPLNVFRRKRRIPLSSLPVHIQISISEKLDILEFARFQLISKHSISIANGIKKKITVTQPQKTNVRNLENWVVAEFGQDGVRFRFEFRKYKPEHALDLEQCNIRFDAECLNLRGDLTEEACQFLKKTNCTMKRVRLFPTVDPRLDPDAPQLCSAETVNELFEVAGTIDFFCCCDYPFPMEFLRLLTFRQMSSLTAHFDDVTNEDLFGLTAKELYISSFSSSIDSWGLNEFIKQFLREERHIERISFDIKDLQESIILSGIQYERPKSEPRIIIIGVEQKRLRRIIHFCYKWVTISK